MRYICEQFVKVINFEHIVSLKKKKKVRERGEFLSQIIFSLSLSLLLNTKKHACIISTSSHKIYTCIIST